MLSASASCSDSKRNNSVLGACSSNASGPCRRNKPALARQIQKLQLPSEGTLLSCTEQEHSASLSSQVFKLLVFFQVCEPGMMASSCKASEPGQLRPAAWLLSSLGGAESASDCSPGSGPWEDRH